MFSTQTAEFSLGMPVPAMDSVKADRGSSQWLVGTSSVRASEDNHLHLFRYAHDTNQLATTATFAHPTGPVRNIVTSPADKSLVLTLAEDTGGGGGGGAATLWKMPPEVLERGMDDSGGLDNDNHNDDDNNDTTTAGGVVSMEERLSLQSDDTASSGVVDLVWRGGWDEESSTHGDVMTVHADGTLTQWDVAFGAQTATRNNQEILQQEKHKQHLQWNSPPRLAWDPHHVDLVAVSTGTMVQLVDWRIDPMSSSASVLRCPHHRFGVTDLDFNPNKPHTLVTSGKDGLVKFWDLRKQSSASSHNNSSMETSCTTTPSPRMLKKLQPLLVARGGHRHWATRVSYNPFHDQLIISSGADSMVNLWRMSTISSAPLVMLEEDDMAAAAAAIVGDSTHHGDTEEGRASVPEGPNVRVSGYEHMDSVNAISWGAADAWIYLSASYDGKVVLNHVPSQEKYKILL
jgi:WD40 repeat protein